MTASPRISTPPGARRRALLQSAAAAALLGLSGCGFALRKAPTFAFSTVRIVGAEGLVARELRLSMVANGLQLVSGATPAQVVLTVTADQQERVVVGQTASGQVRELQLRTRFGFRLRTASEKDLIEDVELLIERDLSYSETDVLSKDAEERLLFRDMVNDAVEQTMRRLAAVKSL